MTNRMAGLAASATVGWCVRVADVSHVVKVLNHESRFKPETQCLSPGWDFQSFLRPALSCWKMCMNLLDFGHGSLSQLLQHGDNPEDVSLKSA